MKKLLGPDEFARHLAHATRRAGFQVQGHDGLTLHCRIDGAPLRCNLATAYAAYQRAPDRLEEIVSAHLAALRTVPAPGPATGTVLPLLNRSSQLTILQPAGMPPPLHQPLAGDLVVNYVIDSPTSMAYINASTLAQPSAPAIPLATLHAEALANLRARTRQQDVLQHGFGDTRFIVYEADDGYAASRVLLDELMAAWAERLPGNMLVGLPNRDFLIACGDRDSRHAAAIAGQVRRDAMRMPRPLTGELFLWENGQLRPRRGTYH